MRGYHGYGHRGWHGGHRWHGHRPFGFFFFLPGLLFLAFFLFFALKFFWPVLVLVILVGLFMRLAKGGPHHGGWGRWRRPEGWDHPDMWTGEKPKRKNDWDDKPKRDDDRRFVQTPDGDWVEIV